MKTIYKYELTDRTTTPVQIPRDFEILSIGLDPQDIVCVWVLVDTLTPTQEGTFLTFGTGWELPDDIKSKTFIGTVKTGMFIWHIFFDNGL